MIVPGTAPRGAATALPGAAPSLTVSTERIRCVMLWLTGATSSIVFIEPSPYELMSFLTMAMFVIGGLSFQVALVPLAVLLLLINIGYSISGWTVFGDERILPWILTSWYLMASAVFFAAMLGENTQRRLDALTRGCVIAGVIASLAAIVGYARVIPSLNDLLLLYDRSRGTFKDPNVLGAFLIFPALLVLQPIITGNLRQALKGSVLLIGLFVPAILLSFSRAAWGQMVYTTLTVVALTFITTRSPAHRLRLVLLSVGGVVLMAAFIAALLSIDAVAELFKQRASLEQSYDVGAQGRFARFGMGFILALDKPLGIGPLQFATFFPEDTHNSLLNAFMSGGWLAGACFPALVALTLAYGFRAVFVRTSWQATTIVVFSAYLGTILESIIIDIDHWRHHFLLLGLMWGLIAATRRHELRTATAAEDAWLYEARRPGLARSGLARPGSPS
jgi:hypothetical protein